MYNKNILIIIKNILQYKYFSVIFRVWGLNNSKPLSKGQGNESNQNSNSNRDRASNRNDRVSLQQFVQTRRYTDAQDSIRDSGHGRSKQDRRRNQIITVSKYSPSGLTNHTNEGVYHDHQQKIRGTFD
jgi:hypothetical protein